MACEDIEQRLASLRSQKRQVEAVLGNLQGAGREAALENLERINDQILAEERNLAVCQSAAATGGSTSTRFTGFVGTIESETRGVSRLWFGLTFEANGANWLQEAGKRVWLTMNMESADRPSHMAQLTLLLEAMRNGNQVQASHDGVADFHKEVAGDSYEANGIRILRNGLGF